MCIFFNPFYFFICVMYMLHTLPTFHCFISFVIIFAAECIFCVNFYMHNILFISMYDINFSNKPNNTIFIINFTLFGQIELSF